MFKMLSTITLFGLLTIPTAHAQSSPIQVKIPFAFTVHDGMLAAGDYQLRYNSTAHVISIQGLDQNASGLLMPAVAIAGADGPGKLVFNCYDKSCYLAQVWQGAAAGGRGLQVTQGDQERRISFVIHPISTTIAAK